MKDKVREFWANHMGMAESINQAKDFWPRSEWNDVRCYVDREAYRKLEAENKRLREALKDLYTQQYGLRNAWCGLWVSCVSCKKAWAYGGNWNALKSAEPCPYCRAKEALKEGE